MRESYMPAKQAEQVEWSRTFVAVVSPVSDEYGLTKAEMGGFEVINAALKAMKAKATDLVSRIQ